VHAHTHAHAWTHASTHKYTYVHTNNHLSPYTCTQEIRMEMFQEGADSVLGGEDDELLAEALRDESDDEDDILVTAI